TQRPARRNGFPSCAAPEHGLRRCPSLLAPTAPPPAPRCCCPLRTAPAAAGPASPLRASSPHASRQSPAVRQVDRPPRPAPARSALSGPASRLAAPVASSRWPRCRRPPLPTVRPTTTRVPAVRTTATAACPDFYAEVDRTP